MARLGGSALSSTTATLLIDLLCLPGLTLAFPAASSDAAKEGDSVTEIHGEAEIDRRNAEAWMLIMFGVQPAESPWLARKVNEYLSRIVWVESVAPDGRLFSGRVTNYDIFEL